MKKGGKHMQYLFFRSFPSCLYICSCDLNVQFVPGNGPLSLSTVGVVNCPNPQEGQGRKRRKINVRFKQDANLLVLDDSLTHSYKLVHSECLLHIFIGKQKKCWVHR